MFRKSLITFVISVGVLLSAQLSAFAQYAPTSGKVLLQKADGNSEPLVGALVEVYRTDVKGGAPAAKTDKKGEFHFAGLMLGAEYTFAVSAPNCSPVAYPNVKPGQEDIVITMTPGNGSKLTEADIRKGTGVAKTGGGEVQLTENQKKERAELEQKNAEIISKNKKMQEGDEVARRSNEEAVAAFKAGNYDLAISKYNEGVAAVPDFVGSTPILLGGKMNALKMKAHAIYMDGAKSADATARKTKYDEANALYDEALGAFQNAADILNNATASSDAAEQKRREALKLALYAAAVEIHRLKSATHIDTAKSPEVSAVVAQYLTLETDPASKLKAQMTLGDIMRTSGNFENAIAAYRQILSTNPDNAEATGKLGLSLFAQGAATDPEDKDKEQEGLNFMQKYTEISPVTATDTQADKDLKTSIKETVDYLKAQKMTPQKPAATPKAPARKHS